MMARRAKTERCVVLRCVALRCVAGMRRMKRAQFIYKLAAYSTYPEQSPGM